MENCRNHLCLAVSCAILNKLKGADFMGEREDEQRRNFQRAEDAWLAPPEDKVATWLVTVKVTRTYTYTIRDTLDEAEDYAEDLQRENPDDYDDEEVEVTSEETDIGYPEYWGNDD